MVMLLLLLHVTAVLHRGEVRPTVTVVVGVRGSPNLTLTLLLLLWTPSSGSLVLVAPETVQGSPTSTSAFLLLVDSHPCSSIGEAGVVAAAAHEGLVVGHLGAHRWGGLVGGAGGGVGGHAGLLLL